MGVEEAKLGRTKQGMAKGDLGMGSNGFSDAAEEICMK